MQDNKNKIEQINRRISSMRGQEEPVKKTRGSGNLAFNIAIELVAGVIVGVIVGMFFDKMFDSAPAFLIICLLLSSVAAFWSIWKKYVNKKDGS